MTLINCTVVNNNTINRSGDGLLMTGSIVDIKNCIFWGHGDDIIITSRNGIPNSLTVNYTLSQEIFAGGTGGWVNDAVSSPAIDAGDPASNYSAEPAANGGRINLGCYGGTAEASQSAGGTGVDENTVFGEYFQFTSSPNPARSGTKISFFLPFTQPVTVNVYDASGKVVARLMDRPLSSGHYEANWDARGIPAGVYFCRLTAGDFVMTKRLLIVN
jgi:hypothetical protein